MLFISIIIIGTLVSEEEKINPEGMTVRITVWDSSRRDNHLSKFTRPISYTRIGKPVLRMDVI